MPVYHLSTGADIVLLSALDLEAHKHQLLNDLRSKPLPTTGALHQAQGIADVLTADRSSAASAAFDVYRTWCDQQRIAQWPIELVKVALVLLDAPTVNIDTLDAGLRTIRLATLSAFQSEHIDAASPSSLLTSIIALAKGGSGSGSSIQSWPLPPTPVTPVAAHRLPPQLEQIPPSPSPSAPTSRRTSEAVLTPMPTISNVDDLIASRDQLLQILREEPRQEDAIMQAKVELAGRQDTQKNDGARNAYVDWATEQGLAPWPLTALRAALYILQVQESSPRPSAQSLKTRLGRLLHTHDFLQSTAFSHMGSTLDPWSRDAKLMTSTSIKKWSIMQQLLDRGGKTTRKQKKKASETPDIKPSQEQLSSSMVVKLKPGGTSSSPEVVKPSKSPEANRTLSESVHGLIGMRTQLLDQLRHERTALPASPSDVASAHFIMAEKCKGKDAEHRRQYERWAAAQGINAWPMSQTHVVLYLLSLSAEDDGQPKPAFRGTIQDAHNAFTRLRRVTTSIWPVEHKASRARTGSLLHALIERGQPDPPKVRKRGRKSGEDMMDREDSAFTADDASQQAEADGLDLSMTRTKTHALRQRAPPAKKARVDSSTPSTEPMDVVTPFEALKMLAEVGLAVCDAISPPNAKEAVEVTEFGSIDDVIKGIEGVLDDLGL